LLLSFFVCFVFVKSFYFFILIGLGFLMALSCFVLIRKIIVTGLISGRVFERALLVSSFSNLKYSCRLASRAAREVYKLG
jgi:hypothetical protein